MVLKRLAIAGCLLISATALAQTGPVDIKDAWARATPGKAENGAAYLTILSPAADRLTEVSTPVANKAELHNMTTEGGVMKMRSLSALDVTPGEPATLKPGGTHVMLMGLNRPLTAGALLVVAMRESPKGAAGTMLASAIGGPFQLVDQNGKRVSDADLKGKWQLLFFGYTHCPDACPTALNEIALALDRLGDKRNAV